MLTACTSLKMRIPSAYRMPASTRVFVHKTISPKECDSAQTWGNSNHEVYWNPTLSNGKLVISTGGTRSIAIDFFEFAKVAVEQGYHVLAIDYPNKIITTDCRESKNRLCFDQFREEIVLGKQNSDLVDVDVANSIESRIKSLLRKLSKDEPERWSQFFPNGEVAWDKVTTVGNSQGAGHAAYLGKLHKLERVIMIAGPQDHFTDLPAGWVTRPGATPGDRYFALLHRDDYYNSKMQVSVYKKLCACDDLSRVIISAQRADDTHNVLLWPIYRESWAKLLR